MNLPPAVAALLTLACFVSGSLMFSYWLGRLRGVDIRRGTDGNPGAVSAMKRAGRAVGVAGLLLDFLKAFLPLFFITQKFGLGQVLLVPIAAAPVFGHCFSPFLNFRGGKGIAATFGIWSGLTLWEGPTVLGLSFVLFKIVFRIRNDALSVMLGMFCLLGYTVIRFANPVLIGVCLLNFAVLLVRHWPILKPRPVPR